MSVTKFPSLKVGDKVQWTSSSHGYALMKRGVVEEVVPKGASPVCADLKSPVGSPRKDESYVVRVGKTETAKGTAYWPLVSKLVKS